MMKQLLLCLVVFLWSAVNTTNYSLPLDNCRSSEIDLLLVTYPLGNSTLQIQRLKNIVGYFLPDEKTTESLRLRVHLMAIVNSTHSQHLIDLNDYTTTSGLTDGLDQLMNQTVKSTGKTDSFSCHSQCEIDAGAVFNTSTRANAKRVAIILTDSSRDSQTYCDNLDVPMFKIRKKVPYYHHYIIEESIYTHLDKRIYNKVISISEADNLANNPTFGATVCGECQKGWLTLKKTGSRSPLSCFYIEFIDIKINHSEAVSMCKNMSADLVTLETKDEITFLEQLCRSKDGLKYERFVHVGLNLNKIPDMMTGEWDNRRPLTIAFYEDIFEYKNTHVAWNVTTWEERTFGFVSLNPNVRVPAILICETEVFRSPPSDKPVIIQQPQDDNFLRVLCHPHFSANEEESLNSIYHSQEDDNFIITNKYVCNNNSLHYARDCYSLDKCDKDTCDTFYKRAGERKQILRCHYNIQFHDENYGKCNDCMETSCRDCMCLPSQWIPDSDHKKIKRKKNYYENSRAFPCIYGKQSEYEIMFNNQLRAEVTSCKDELIDSFLPNAPTCVYLKDRNNRIIGCGNYLQLDDCENFICSDGLYKCPFSYCVPVYYINDGVNDCPYGDDENITVQGKNLFKCEGRVERYILPVHVCDNKKHCPNGDDEYGCFMSCPEGFMCGGGVVSPATNKRIISFRSLCEFDSNTLILHLSDIDLSRVRASSHGNLQILKQLHASNCSLQSVKNIFCLSERDTSLRLIDFSYNNIRKIVQNGIFSGTKYLTFLNLSHNTELNSFELNLNNLKTLDLSFTSLISFKFTMRALENLNLSHTRIHIFYFPDKIVSKTLQSLDVSSTHLTINKQTAESLAKLKINNAFYCDLYQMCCDSFRGEAIPERFCFAPVDAISSCENLLGNPVKRMLLWAVAVVSFVGNVTVLVFRFVFERAVITKSYRLFVLNLGLSDLITSVYLFIVAGNDVYYRDDYVMYEYEWRHSPLCSAAGFLATLSCETSAMFVLLMTLDRYLAVRFPFGTYRVPRDLKYFLLILSWTVGVVLSLVPLAYQDWNIYSSNGMCLGLPMRNYSENGLMYFFGAFLVLPGILFMLITIGQMAIFLNISGEKTNESVNIHCAAKRRREITVAKNLALVVMSNFLCWFPLFVFGLMAANGYELSPETYSWLVVFVLPLNSAINPVLYTLPVVYKRWREFKNGHA